MSTKRFGCFESSDCVSTHGSGFFIHYRDEYFFVTCRHVVEKCNTAKYFFMYQTSNRGIPNHIDWYVSINDVRYSQKGNNDFSDDIALFKIGKKIIEEYKVNFYEFSDEYEFKNKPLQISGYANQFITDNWNGVEVILPPLSLEGTYNGLIEISDNKFTNISYPVDDKKAGVFLNCGYSNLEGISGGPVLLKDNNRVVGMIIGTESTCNPDKWIDFFVFIEFGKIIEALDSNYF